MPNTLINKLPETPSSEKERVNALKEYSILDTLAEKEYDDITFLAAEICDTPISLITLLDEKRQWFKSHYGMDASETPKSIAFCAHAINDKNSIFIIPNSRKDDRFKDNQLVTGNPGIVFYAGIPLVTPKGFPLGTLCVIDRKPRKLKKQQLKALQALSNQILKLLELRKKTDELKSINFTLKEKNKGLNDFVRIAAHDIKSPMNNIAMLSGIIKDEYSKIMPPEGLEIINHIHSSTEKLTQLVDGILKYSIDTNLIANKKEVIDIKLIIDDIITLINIKNQFSFNLIIKDSLILFSNKTAIQQIFLNLISNSIKYNTNDKPEITILVNESKEFVKINIIDNGIGIKKRDLKKIFNLFSTTSNKDKKGSFGTGIGLATVKSLVESLGGVIAVDSDYGHGTCFEFTIKK